MIIAVTAPLKSFETSVDEDKKIEIEVNDKSYLEEVYSNPLFEDTSDMWLALYREEAEIEEVSALVKSSGERITMAAVEKALEEIRN